MFRLSPDLWLAFARDMRRDPRLAGHSPGAAGPHPHRPRPPASRLLNRQASPNPPASAASTITGLRSPAERPAADEAMYPARSEGGLDRHPAGPAAHQPPGMPRTRPRRIGPELTTRI